MSYGYLGDTSTSIKQQVKNAGVLSVSDVLDLKGKGQLGGSLELIEEQTVSGTPSAVEFINLANNPYDVYFLQVFNIQTSASSQLKLTFSNNNGSSYVSTGYNRVNQFGTVAGSFGIAGATNQTDISTQLLSSTNINSTANGYMYLYNFLDSSKYSCVTYQNFSAWTDVRMAFGGSFLPTAETHNAFKLVPSAGTFLAGNFKLYGMKQI